MPTDELYRPARRTPYAPADLAAAFASAWVELTDAPASRPGVTLATAQALHEAPPERCWNNILTGIKREAGYAWTALGTHENFPAAYADELVARGLAEKPRMALAVAPGEKTVYLKANVDFVATHFRCFDTIEAAAWWSLRKYLREGERYATAAVRTALEFCDAYAFAHELKRKGYFSATAAEYWRALEGAKTGAQRAVSAVDWEALPIRSAATRSRTLGAVGLTVHEMRRESERGGGGDENA